MSRHCYALECARGKFYPVRLPQPVVHIFPTWKHRDMWVGACEWNRQPISARQAVRQCGFCTTVEHDRSDEAVDDICVDLIRERLEHPDHPDNLAFIAQVERDVAALAALERGEER